MGESERRAGTTLIGTLAVLLAVLVLAAGCEWAVGSHSSVQIGWVEDEPIVFPMTIDPSDHTPPSELINSLGEFCFSVAEANSQSAPCYSWDGVTPFSWQCYAPKAAHELRGLEPTAVGPLKADFSNSAGAFVRAEWTSELQQKDLGTFCPLDADFAPLPHPDPNGPSFYEPAEICYTTMLVNGEAQGTAIYGGTFGPLTAASNEFSFGVFACTGHQFNSGSQRLVAELVSIDLAGTSASSGTTIPTPTTEWNPYPTVSPTTTTTAPTSLAPVITDLRQDGIRRVDLVFTEATDPSVTAHRATLTSSDESTTTEYFFTGGPTFSLSLSVTPGDTVSAEVCSLVGSAEVECVTAFVVTWTPTCSAELSDASLPELGYLVFDVMLQEDSLSTPVPNNATLGAFINFDSTTFSADAFSGLQFPLGLTDTFEYSTPGTSLVGFDYFLQIEDSDDLFNGPPALPEKRYCTASGTVSAAS
ncbi:MAG: hypothetical protein RIB98_19570 [Acidimicrobiales bacterium]